MGCSTVTFDDMETVSETWFEDAQGALYEKWVKMTRHKPGARGGTWACEIYYGCRSCREHLSLPCSLLGEANEIGAFLKTTCYTDRPETFLRLYLILLSEFVGQLRSVAGLLKLSIGKPPKSLCIWSNRWAKHRLEILVQHHPSIIFTDQYGLNWSEAEFRLRSEPISDPSGREYPVIVIDTNWLSEIDSREPKIQTANGPHKAVVVVPRLQTFLDETIVYFRRFVDECLRCPELVQQFESSHHKQVRQATVMSQ